MSKTAAVLGRLCDTCRKEASCRQLGEGWYCYDSCYKQAKEAAKRNNAEQREDGRDEWATGWREYGIIRNEWKLQPSLDVAASADNTKCFDYITKEQDALKQDWRPANGVVWLQPPYSSPLLELFIEKALFESTANGIACMYLLPDWTDRAWFDLIEPFPHKFWRDPDKPLAKQHRIKHVPPNPSIKPGSPRYGSVHGVIDVWRKFV